MSSLVTKRAWGMHLKGAAYFGVWVLILIWNQNYLALI